MIPSGLDPNDMHHDYEWLPPQPEYTVEVHQSNQATNGVNSFGTLTLHAERVGLIGVDPIDEVYFNIVKVEMLEHPHVVVGPDSYIIKMTVVRDEWM